MGVINKIIHSENPILIRIRNIKFLRNLYLKFFKGFDDKLGVYLTFGCNLKCPYCVNQFFGKIHRFDMLSGKEWIEIINREGKDVILTGGEPALHKDFIEIINGIDEHININFYTNLNWSEDFLRKYILEVNRPVEFYASYHVCSGHPKKFIYVLNELKKAGKFKGSVHTVKVSNIKAKKLKKYFSMKGVKLAIDDDQYEMFKGCSKRFKKKVVCTNKIYLIAPNGVRFRCLSYMLRNKQPFENLKIDKLRSAVISGRCDEYGYCTPCDMLSEIKIKEIKDAK